MRQTITHKNVAKRGEKDASHKRPFVRHRNRERVKGNELPLLHTIEKFPLLGLKLGLSNGAFFFQPDKFANLLCCYFVCRWKGSISRSLLACG